LFIRQQTSVINAIRAHLAEFGIVAPVGRNGVTKSAHKHQDRENLQQMPFDHVPQHVRARSFTGTPEYDQSSNQRKKVEMRFAHLKTHHRFERMRLRGLSGARDEFHLAATVQNLKTLANYLWPSPPNVAAACVT
jgi:hypothetical protein